MSVMERFEMIIASRPWSVDGDAFQWVQRGRLVVEAPHFDGLVATMNWWAWTFVGLMGSILEETSGVGR